MKNWEILSPYTIILNAFTIFSQASDIAKKLKKVPNLQNGKN